MYIPNKPPKRRTNIQIPQHIRKLIGQIQKTNEKGDLSILTKILERFATLVTNDNILLNIFNHFEWDESSRSFLKEISYDNLVEVIEKEYEIKLNEIDFESEENFPVVGAGGYPTHTSIGLNFNSSLSDSSNFIKNEAPNDLFCVKKPIAISNSYGNDTYPMNDPDFLTNSAKGWYQETHREEDSSLVSNWKSKTPAGNTHLPSMNQGNSYKVPSFNVERQPLIRATRSNLFNTNNNYNLPDLKEELIGYNDYMKSISGSKLGNFHSNYSSSFTLGSNYGNNNHTSFNQEINEEDDENEKVLTDKKIKKRKTEKKKTKARRSKVKKVKTKIITNSFSPLKRKDRSYQMSNQSRNSNFGLKEISKKVKEIVKNYKSTTYKEISDILVSGINERDIKDEKNIRRRIYDSLNVMKAMKLFTKDRSTKRILWNGESNYAEEDNKGKVEELSNFSFNKKKSIYEGFKMVNVEEIGHMKNSLSLENENKKKCFDNLSSQFHLLTNLISKNKFRHDELSEDEKIKLPFIILEFPEHNSNINIISNESKTKLHFSLDNALRVYGDLDAISKIKND